MKPERNCKNSKNLEEIQKTWRKFPKIFWPPCLNWSEHKETLKTKLLKLKTIGSFYETTFK